MNTYEFAQKIYKSLSRDDYKTLIEVMERLPDEFITMMKKVHEENDPSSRPSVHMSQSIIDQIEDAVIRVGLDNKSQAIFFTEDEEIAAQLFDITHKEINEIWENVINECPYETVVFSVFNRVLKNLKSEGYPELEELIEELRNNKNQNIKDTDIENMVNI